MGAKTALLAFADGDVRSALAGASDPDRAATERLVRRVHPGFAVEGLADGRLDGTYPPDDVTYALVRPGIDLVIDRRLVLDRPSELPEHLRRLPFHPLEMGEDALRFLFGFVIEGWQEDTDIDAGAVPVRGFRVTDPTGREQAEREAAYAEAVANMGPPRFFQMGPNGPMEEISIDGL